MSATSIHAAATRLAALDPDALRDLLDGLRAAADENDVPPDTFDPYARALGRVQGHLAGARWALPEESPCAP